MMFSTIYSNNNTRHYLRPTWPRKLDDCESQKSFQASFDQAFGGGCTRETNEGKDDYEEADDLMFDSEKVLNKNDCMREITLQFKSLGNFICALELFTSEDDDLVFCSVWDYISIFELALHLDIVIAVISYMRHSLGYTCE